MGESLRPLRLLSLDGGGIRGLSSLYILKQIMAQLDYKVDETLQRPLLPCHYFDLIAGTSTGGLIAVMLGTLEMDIDTCIREYKDISPKIFPVETLVSKIGHTMIASPRFDPTPLEEAMKRLVVEHLENKVSPPSEDSGTTPEASQEGRIAARDTQTTMQEWKGEYIRKLFGMMFGRGPERTNPLPATSGGHGERKLLEHTLFKFNASRDRTNPPCKVVVCANAESIGRHCRFRSYQSPWDAIDDLPIWQACRATSAAPMFFPPMLIGNPPVAYVDGGLGYNCPVRPLVEEAKRIWPNREIGCIVSIGTGAPKFREVGRSLLPLIETLKAVATDTENTARDFRNEHLITFGIDQKVYFRFNVDRGLEDVGLEEAKEVPIIQQAAQDYAANKWDEILKCASQLHKIATFAGAPPTTETPAPQTLSLEQTECVNTLLFPAYAARFGRVDKPNPGTCGWIRQHSSFRHWHNSTESSLLLLSGHPGCGKSVISKYLIGELPNIIDGRKAKPLVAHFFFHDQGDDIEKTLNGMLRTLLYQICVESPALVNALTITNTYKTLKAQQRGSDVEWPPHVLEELFSKLRGNREASIIYIVIDALDECTSSSAPKALRFLHELTSPATACQFKVFLTCRPSTLGGLLDNTFNECPRICLNSTDKNCLMNDVERFISSEFAKLSRATELEDLRDLTIDRAQGNFLWATIAMNRVVERSKKGDKVRDLVAMVEHLPSEMDELYKKILSQLCNKKDIEERKVMLLWVIFAQRPLTLSEFRIAIELYKHSHQKTSQTQLTPNNTLRRRPGSELELLEDSFAENVLQQRLVILSGGLLEVKPSGSDSLIVQLIHQSAKEYLLSHFSDWFVGSYLESMDRTGHFHLAMGCLEYLAFEEFGKVPSGRISETFTDEHVFLDYSTSYWPTHCRIVSESAILGEKFLFLVDQGGNFSLAVRRLRRFSIGYSPDSPLTLTSAHGLEYLTVLLLRNGVRPDSRDNSSGRTSLLWAAVQGHLEIVKLLLATKRVEPDSRDNSGWTPLSCAVVRGHLGIVKLLLATKGVNPDDKDNSGRTPLSWAADGGHLEIVKLLLGIKGIETGSKDSYWGHTPLSCAAEGGHLEVTKLLLAAGGAKPYSKDNSGRTPLSRASERGHLEIAKLLLAAKGIDPDSEDNSGQTPLSWAAEGGHLEIVKLLLATKGVNPESKDNSGRTPLSWAAGGGHVEVVKLLLNKGVQPDSKDNWGQTPLLRAVEGRHPETVKLLATKGVELDSKDISGQTLLSWAAEGGHLEIVNLLLVAKGIEPDSKDNSGRTPLLRAAKGGHLEIAKLLLATEGVDPDSVDDSGRTPLSWAADRGHLEIIKLLLATNDVDPDSKDCDSRTPLSCAANGGHLEIGKLLPATKGVNPDSMDGSGRTPLSWTAERGHLGIFMLLLATNNVGLDSKDSSGRTPLSWAAAGGHLEIVMLLLDNGVEPDSEDNLGQTPLSWAADRGHLEIVELLLAIIDSRRYQPPHPPI